MRGASTTSSPFVLPQSPVESDLVAKYFRGLGDPTRVRILELLQEHGELSVGELVERLGDSQPKVSNHLACLRWCGFVLARRQPPSVIYGVADERVLELLAISRALLADNAEHVAACLEIDGTIAMGDRLDRHPRPQGSAGSDRVAAGAAALAADSGVRAEVKVLR